MKNMNRTKIRVYLLAMFAFIMIYQMRDIFTENLFSSAMVFIVAPIVIYIFTKFLWDRNNSDDRRE